MSSHQRRVVVTAAGCITPIGNTIADFSNAVFAAQSGISALPLNPDQSLTFTSAAQVKNFNPQETLPSSLLLLTERSAQFGLIAAQQAVQESNLLARYAPHRIAILMGCSVGGREADEPEVVKLYTQQGRVHPFTVARVMASSGASQISILLGITGPVLNLSTACASSTHALGLALHMIRSGSADAALAGGHEAPLTYGFLKAWEAMRVVSPTSCKPFGADRDGMTLGEGSAVLVLEEREQALRRGATIYAEICGFGMSSDAFHITQPQPSGPAAAMQQALEDAHLHPEEVSYINAHGTGTAANDKAEAEAIHTVFGAHAHKLPVSSTKGLHGHLIGAAGAIEALATVLALRSGQLPPNAGPQAIDPSVQLNVATQSRPFTPQAALSNSFAFGGLNASLVFRAHE